MEYKDSHGDFLQEERAYVSIHNPNYVCYIGFKKNDDFEVIDINNPCLKYASEMFKDWSKALIPINNLEKFIEESKSTIGFLEMLQNTDTPYNPKRKQSKRQTSHSFGEWAKEPLAFP